MKRRPDAERVVLRAVIAAAGLRTGGFFPLREEAGCDRVVLRGVIAAAGLRTGGFIPLREEAGCDRVALLGVIAAAGLWSGGLFRFGRSECGGAGVKKGSRAIAREPFFTNCLRMLRSVRTPIRSTLLHDPRWPRGGCSQRTRRRCGTGRLCTIPRRGSHGRWCSKAPHPGACARRRRP